MLGTTAGCQPVTTRMHRGNQGQGFGGRAGIVQEKTATTWHAPFGPQTIELWPIQCNSSMVGTVRWHMQPRWYQRGAISTLPLHPPTIQANHRGPREWGGEVGGQGMACSSPHTHHTITAALLGGSSTCCHLARVLAPTHPVGGRECLQFCQARVAHGASNKPSPAPLHAWEVCRAGGSG